MFELNWVTLGLLSTVAFSFINLADRKLLHKLNAHPIAYPAFATTLGTIFTAIFSIFLLNGVGSFTQAAIFWGVIVGLIGVVGSGLFYFALSNSEVSKIIAFDRIKLIIVLIIAAVFFNEPLTWWMLCGAILIIGGNMYISTSSTKRFPKLETGAWLMIASGIVGALLIIPQKIGVRLGDPMIIALIASATRSTLFVTGAVVFRRRHLSDLRKQLQRPKMIIALLIRSLASATGWTAFYFALSLGFIYQVTGLSQLRPAIVVFIAWLLLKEQEVKKRMIGTVIIVIGALFIVLSIP